MSVIVPVKDGADVLATCLRALIGQDYPPERFEVIVVDNGSAVSPVTALPDDPRVRLTVELTPGSYAARNTGLEMAKGELIAFTDADCVPTAGWLSAAAGRLAASPEIDMIGGRVNLTYRTGVPVNGPEWLEFLEGFPQERYLKSGFAVTANMVTRRSVFNRIGPFDATLMSGGDAEWGRRVRAAGGVQEYMRSALVHHPARDSWDEIRSKTIRTTGGVIRRSVNASHPRRQLMRLVVGQAYRLLRTPLSVWRDQRLPDLGVRRALLLTRWGVDLIILRQLIPALLRPGRNRQAHRASLSNPSAVP